VLNYEIPRLKRLIGDRRVKFSFKKWWDHLSGIQKIAIEAALADWTNKNVTQARNSFVKVDEKLFVNWVLGKIKR